MDSSGWTSHPPRRRDGAKRNPSVSAVPLNGHKTGRPSAGARGISRSRVWRVKTPAPTRGARVGAVGEMRVRTWGYLPCALAAAFVLAPQPSLARSAEPLCDWLSGIGDAAQAQSQGDAGRAEAAARRALAARPHGSAATRAQAALGVALLRRDEPALAAEALESALGAPVPGRAHLAFARGEALLAAGDAHAASRLFEQAAGATDLAVSTRARLRAAQALLSAGLASEAVPQLQALLAEAQDEAGAAAVRLALAQGLRSEHQDELAAGAYRALWLDLPERPEARAAGDALAEWRAAGGPVPPDSGADHAIRAERLLAAGRPDASLLELSAASAADEPAADPDRAAVLAAQALLALGRHAEAEQAALEVAGARAEGVQRGARLVLARCSARADRVEEASRYYADVAASSAPVPGLPEARQRDLADDAAFLSAWLFYDAGDFGRAIPLLEAFARSHRRSRRAEDALWFAAWSWYRLGRRADADRAFASLSRGPLADGALYWRARLAARPERQRALYRSALAMGGTGWYGVLARARLRSLGAGVARPRPPPSRTAPELRDARAAGRLTVAVELLGLGLRDEALAELGDLARSPRVRSSAAALGQLAAFAESAELPFRMARDHLLPTRRTIRWAYPEPHRAALASSARGFGVDPSLLLAVMRRESSFRPEARSAAGAEGLLQLRPATADRLGAMLGLPGGVETRLTEPEVAIALGAQYLGLLLSRFGDPAAALAAYNAGPQPAADWARERAGMALDEWVESIPYRETRQYVKIVVAEWDVYRSLSGEPPPPLDPLRPVPVPAPGVSF